LVYCSEDKINMEKLNKENKNDGISEVHRATSSDAQEINQLYFDTWVKTYPNKDYGVSQKDLEEWLRPSLSEDSVKNNQEWLGNLPENVSVSVVRDKDKIVGFCYATKGDNSEHNKLRSIYVNTDYQGKGIGKALWDDANKFFDHSMPTDVQVVAYNEKAINFYKRLGFVENGNIITDDEDYRLKNGVIIPQKNLILENKK